MSTTDKQEPGERLEAAKAEIADLEERLLEINGQLRQSRSHNEQLTVMLQQVKEQMTAMRMEVDKLTQPPSAYGSFLSLNEDGSADIVASGRKMRVTLHPDLDPAQIKRGDEVVLNEGLNIVSIREADLSGDVVNLKELLDHGRRAMVVVQSGEERIVGISEALDVMSLKTGDVMVLDPRSGIVVERLERKESQDLVLEEVPDVTYDQVGGLDEQIEAITDAVELPYLHRELFAKYHLPAPKGILLYGPPGCGKTLIAKAVANALAHRVAEVTGQENVRSYFLNIKGPEQVRR